MIHRGFQPPDELRDTIQEFWYTKMDFGHQASTFDVMPDGYAELVFLFGSGCSVAREGHLQPLPSPFIMGLLNQPVVLHATNVLHVIGIKCYPWTVFDLLGLPSGNTGVHVFEHPIVRLQPVLAAFVAAEKIDEAINLVQQYFLDARAGVAPNSLLYKAGAAMREANGILPVSGVAAAAHATVRTLERQFKHSSGHSVKDVSTLIRFEQVRNYLWTDPDVNLAGLALDMGYTDQSHLSREFKRYSGTTPGAFSRETKKRKLAVSNDFVAFIQDQQA